MIELVYSPAWFYGKDIIIDIISIIVLFLIGLSSIRYYLISKKNRKQLMLAGSFFTLAASFLFKILTNFTIYYKAVQTRRIGFVTFTYHAWKSTNTLFFAGFLMYRLLTLLGLYYLYSIYVNQKKSHIFFVAYLLVVLTYFSQSAYYIFHVTSLILLLMISISFWQNYRKNRMKSTKMLAASFAVISFSQVVFIFVKVWNVLYVMAEIMQLIGYIGLLITFIMVLKYGKKKRKNRHHP